MFELRRCRFVRLPCLQRQPSRPPPRTDLSRGRDACLARPAARLLPRWPSAWTRSSSTQHGLPLTSYEVLHRLEEADSGRMRMCDLAEQAQLSRSGLTRLVDRLEREGLLERCSCEHDARGAYACLTELRPRAPECGPGHAPGGGARAIPLALLRGRAAGAGRAPGIASPPAAARGRPLIAVRRSAVSLATLQARPPDAVEGIELQRQQPHLADSPLIDAVDADGAASCSCSCSVSRLPSTTARDRAGDCAQVSCDSLFNPLADL